MKDKVIELQKEQPETRAEMFSMVVNSYNPGSGEAGKWGGGPWVQGQPGLHTEKQWSKQESVTWDFR